MPRFWIFAALLLFVSSLGLSACSDDDDDSESNDDDIVGNDDDSQGDDDDSQGDDDDSQGNDDDGDDDDGDDDDDDFPPVPSMVPNHEDGVLRVGMAQADVTPEISESYLDKNHDNRWGNFLPFIDVNGNFLFDADEELSYEDANDNDRYDRGERLLDAEASGNPAVVKGQEPYDDVNGNGKFDAVFIGGYGNGRVAQGVHDPIMAIATVIALDGEYVAIVAIDLVGIEAGRTRAMADNLHAEGFDGRRLIVTATHCHQSPDGIGIWGINELSSGFDPAYLGWLETQIPEIVAEAVANLEPAEIWAGSMRMRDYDPWLTNEAHGGLNPLSNRFIGFINDIRDPLIVDDLLAVMQFRRPDSGEVIGTMTNWSGHPEVAGDDNVELSSDFNYYLRKRLAETYGAGMVMATPADVGGMQSTLGGDIPMVDENGDWLWEKDEEGNDIPVLSDEESFEFARSTGYILADAANAILEGLSEPVPVEALSLQRTKVKLAFNNPLLYAGVIGSILDVPLDFLTPPEDCGAEFGCGDANLWMLRLEPSIQIGTAPGELFPELFLGLPDADDFDDPRPNRWFVQHNPDDEMSQHADPYTVGAPVREAMSGEVLNLLLGLAEAELGYLVPEDDFNLNLDHDGDHYEETNSMGDTAATEVVRGLREMAADPDLGKVPARD